MKLEPKKPKSPNFSSGPTKKPEGWSIKKLKIKYLGRYHRSEDVKDYLEKIFLKIRQTLKIPKEYKIFFLPGSCTGSMTSVLNSILGKNSITSIIYDYWGQFWYEELKKLNFQVNTRKNMNGTLPSLQDIPINNDIIFVWNATSNGMTISNLNFISNNHKGLVISDLTSAVFACKLPWKLLDVSVFSLQKALGAESQKGVLVLSPKAVERLKKDQLKLFDLKNFDFLVNTPSLLSFADLDQCIDIYNKNGGLNQNASICVQNKKVLDLWEKNHPYIKYFCQNKKFQSVTPSFFIFKKKLNHKKIFSYLSKNKIAYDIQNFRKVKDGIRIWNGPNIKKNDLIALTNWLDWSFNKFI